MLAQKHSESEDGRPTIHIVHGLDGNVVGTLPVASRSRTFIVNHDRVLQPNQILEEDWRLVDLIPTLVNESSAIEWLAERGLLVNSKTCETCAIPMSLQKYKQQEDKHAWRCLKCRQRRTTREGSVFSKSRLSLKKIIMLIYFWAEQLPQKFLIRELDLGKTACIDWKNFLRSICAQDIARNPIRLGGDGTTVEIDKSYSFHRKYYGEAANPDHWVFGAFERGTSRILLVEVRDHTKATLEALIQHWILPETRIISDSWTADAEIDQLPQNYVHERVDRQDKHVGPHVRDVHTNTVKSLWQKAKGKLTYQYGVSNQLLPNYLMEYVWLNEKQKKNQRAFNAMIIALSEQFPV